jgi:hypothetical protein
MKRRHDLPDLREGVESPGLAQRREIGAWPGVVMKSLLLWLRRRMSLLLRPRKRKRLLLWLRKWRSKNMFPWEEI